MGLISDIFDIWRGIEDYNTHKDQERFNQVWNEYNRQVDMHALTGLQLSQGYQIETLNEQRTTLGERAALTRERANTTQRRGEFIGRASQERSFDARRTNWRQWELSRAQIGTRSLELDAMGSQIEHGRNILGAQWKALYENADAERREIDARDWQILVERGVFDQNTAQKFNVLRKMRENSRLQIEVLGGNLRDQEQLFSQKFSQLQTQAALLGITAALQQADINENAAHQTAMAQLGQAVRSAVGSRTGTEAARIERGRSRALTLHGAQTREAAAGISARFATLSAERSGVRRGALVERSNLATREAQLQAQHTGLLGAVRSYGAQEQVQEAGINRARVSLRNRVDVAQAQFVGRGAELAHQEGIVGSQRNELGAQQRLSDAQFLQTRNEARRSEEEGQIRQAEAQGEYAQQQQEARELDRQDLAVGREVEQVKYGQLVTDWQLDKLPDLPLQGASRSSVSLALQIGSELMD